jgi:hypothetical protein
LARSIARYPYAETPNVIAELDPVCSGTGDARLKAGHDSRRGNQKAAAAKF